MTEQTTVAIMCYGLFGKQYHRSDTEMTGLMEYINSCAEFVRDLYNKDQLSGVIFCGGITNPTLHPNISEAKTTADYFIRNAYSNGIPIIGIGTMPICLEETSKNTAQNIYFSLQHIEGSRSVSPLNDYFEALDEVNFDLINLMRKEESKWRNLSKKVTFICDTYRQPKVKVQLAIAKMHLCEKFDLDVISFPRKDIHPNSCWSKQFGIAITYVLNPIKFFYDLKTK